MMSVGNVGLWNLAWLYREFDTNKEIGKHKDLIDDGDDDDGVKQNAQ